MLLPPPPLYRPFQQLAEKSSTDLKSKTPAKKPAATKPAATGEKKLFTLLSVWQYLNLSHACKPMSVLFALQYFIAFFLLSCLHIPLVCSKMH